MMQKTFAILVLFLCFAADIKTQVVIRGPYLQSGSETAITVRWRTHIMSNAKVRYGTSISNLNQYAIDTTSSINHEVRVTGLDPGTLYYYTVGTMDSVLIPAHNEQYFNAHPAEGSTDLYKFWILGDCGTKNMDQRNVRDAYYNYIGTDHTDGMIFLGDNAYITGTDSEYQVALFQNMYENKLKNTIAWSTLGNHDGFTASSETQTGPYYDIFTFPKFGESGGLSSGTEAYYSFDYGNIHFISLDSYDTDRSVGGEMYTWCLSDIQNTTQKWIVAFWHHPPYTKGSYDSDVELEESEMRQNFLPILEDNGVDLVLSGHSHVYERSYFINGHYGISSSFDSIANTVGDNGYNDGKIGQGGSYKKFSTGDNAHEGAVYITAGNSGQKSSSPDFGHQAMYYSVSELGSCLIEVEGDRLDVKFIREIGVIEDYFTIQKDPVDCVIGMACDDGDSCTTGDVFDSDCQCIGATAPDDDGDGICNDEDQCPDFHDAILGDHCNNNSANCLPSICLSDFNQDGLVDGSDFALFLGSYNVGCSNCCPTDLNDSGNTNGDDFAIFIGNFGLSCQ